MNLKFGVPCSKIKGRITDVDINCTNESEAMAIACGCILSGKKPLVYMQNSGLMHIADIVLSLYKAYEIPLPDLLLSIRYKPHHHMGVGNITREFLKLIDYDGRVEIVEEKMESG